MTRPHTRRPPKGAALREFEIPCRVERSATVTVRAVDAADAITKFETGDWFGEAGEALLNWAATGAPKATGT